MKQPILTTLIALIASWCNLYAQANLTGSLTNGLVAYYPLNGDAKDYSSNSNNGIVYGAYASNNAFYFNGSAYIQGGNVLQDYSSNATLVCWIKTTNNSGDAFAKQKPYPDQGGLTLGLQGSNPTVASTHFYTEPGSNPGYSGKIVAELRINGISAVNDNNWHCLVTTVNGNSLNLYVDGILNTSIPYRSDSLYSDQPLLIGCSAFPRGPGWDVPHFYTGFIKNVLAYNRPLSSKEIATLYSAGRAPVTTDTFGSGTNQFSIDFVEIGNPGNSNDTTGYGGVPYGYRIGKYTISQNQVDAATRNGLQNVTAGAYSGDLPAANISWYEAAAYVNWLNRSQGYQPAYNLTFSNGNWSMALWPITPDKNGNMAWTLGGTNLFRNANCAYFLPSENEWYKAAYYDPNKNGVTGGYWAYPTGSDIPPKPVTNGTDSGTAVYGWLWSQGAASVFKAGGLSPYGTMGQGGNVWQWCESAFDGTNDLPPESRAFHGCSYYDGVDGGYLKSSSVYIPSYGNPSDEFVFRGFRVASIDDSWLTNGLVAYYPFDGDAKDYSGNGRDASLLFNNGWGFTNGLIGFSLKCENSGNVTFGCYGSNNTPLVSTNFSVSEWLYIPSSNSYNHEWVYLFSGWGDFFLRIPISVSSNSVLNSFDIGSGNQNDHWDLQSKYSIPLNEWFHVVVTHKDNSGNIYINGGLLSSFNGRNTLDINNFVIGNSGGYQYPFVGKIDEVRIYSRTLSSNEVAGLYELDGGVLPPPSFSQTILFPDISPVTYGVPPFTLSATASSGLPVSFSSSSTNISIAGNSVTVLGTGTATIVASQLGDDTYAAAPSVTNSLVVNGPSALLKNQTISFPPLKPKSWTNAPFALTAKASSKLPITYTSSDPSVATVSGGILTPFGVGTTTITAFQGGNTIYNPATPVSQPQVITQAGQTITFPKIAPHTYGDAPFVLSASSSSGLPITFVSSATNVATISSNVVTIVGAGTAQITALQSGNALYTAAKPAIQTLKVNKANQTVTFNPVTPVTYTNGGTLNFNGTASSGLPLTYKSSTPKVITVLTGLPRGVMLGRGTTTITATQAGDANYNKASATNSITIQ